MKAKSIRFLSFLTPNFTPEENKGEMDTQKTYMFGKCPNTELFLVRISRIRTEYGDLLLKSPYLDTFQAV